MTTAIIVGMIGNGEVMFKKIFAVNAEQKINLNNK